MCVRERDDERERGLPPRTSHRFRIYRISPLGWRQETEHTLLLAPIPKAASGRVYFYTPCLRLRLNLNYLCGYVFPMLCLWLSFVRLRTPP